MAKSNLDLRGAKGPKLELDYLRLVFAIKEIRKQGDSAQGYLVVMTDEILNRAKKWEYKYKGEEFVTLTTASLSNQTKRTLENEKTRNTEGMVAGASGGNADGLSNADNGRDIGEGALSHIIAQMEPNVQRIRDESKFPLGIRWDFYGSIM
ncbi:hypothetical protein ACFLU4_04260 [Chloroflexota bacterium]